MAFAVKVTDRVSRAGSLHENLMVPGRPALEGHLLQAARRGRVSIQGLKMSQPHRYAGLGFPERSFA